MRNKKTKKKKRLKNQNKKPVQAFQLKPKKKKKKLDLFIICTGPVSFKMKVVVKVLTMSILLKFSNKQNLANLNKTMSVMF